MSTSECLGTSVMSRYGRIRSRNDLPDQNFRDSSIIKYPKLHSKAFSQLCTKYFAAENYPLYGTTRLLCHHDRVHFGRSGNGH